MDDLKFGSSLDSEWGNSNKSHLPPNIDATRKIWRLDTSFNTVHNKHFCGGDHYYRTGKCDKTYKEVLTMVTLPFDIMTMLVIIGGIAAYAGRYCCNAFGGKLPSKGCFKGEPKDSDQGYTPFQRRLYLFFVIGIWVFCVIAAFVGISGNSTLENGVNSLEKIVGNIPRGTESTLKYARLNLPNLEKTSIEVNPNRVASEWKLMYAGLANMTTAVEPFSKKVDDGTDKVKSAESARSNLLFWSLITAVFLSTVCIAGAWCPVMITLSLPVVLVICCVAWASAGAHLAAAVATADFCVGLDEGLKNATKPSPIQFFIPNWWLVKPGAQQFKSHADGIVQRAVKQACTTHEKLCKKPAYKYPNKHGVNEELKPVQCPNIPCNEKNIDAFVKGTQIHDFEFGCAKLSKGNIVTVDCKYTDHAVAKKECLAKYGNTDVIPCDMHTGQRYRNLTMAECVTNCTKNYTVADVKKVLKNDQLATGLKSVATKVDYYSTDKWVHDPVRALENSLCWDVTEATDYCIAASCLVALTFTVGFCIYFGAQKRFNTRYSDEHWPETSQGGDGSSQPLLGQDTKDEAPPPPPPQ
jgi:hypothetical protein